MKLYDCLMKLVSDDSNVSVKLIDYDSLKEFLVITSLDEPIVEQIVLNIQNEVEATSASDFTVDRFGSIIRSKLDEVGYIPTEHFFKYLNEYIEEKYARLAKRNVVALVGFDENDKTVEYYLNSCIECRVYSINDVKKLQADILDGVIRKIIIDAQTIEKIIADEMKVLSLASKRCEVVIDIM